MNSVSKSNFAQTPLVAALLLACVDAGAASPAPDAGSILQQLQPVIPTAPQSPAPSLQIEPKAPAKLPASAPFEVKAIRIIGNTVFTTEMLHALVADQEGRALTLPQLDSVAGLITAYYQQHGYPLARAIIPAQTISGGEVVIQVLEARYDRVRVDNSSQAKNSLLEAIAAPLRSGEVIAERDLDRTLLLMSDVPGVNVNAVLKPGTAVGTSDLDIVTTPATSTIATLSVDNFGNRYVGRTRLTGSASLINPFHHGDIFSATVLTCGSGMNFGRISYDTLLNGAGTRVGGAYSLVRYELGKEIRPLDANGTAGVTSLWVRHPLLRSKQANLYGQFQFDSKRLRDRVDRTDTRTDRNLNNALLSLNGDIRDNLLAGGISVGSLALTSGHVNFDDAVAEAVDAASVRTEGSFLKWNLNLSRLQGLTANDFLYINFAAQWADSNLDSAEKMTVGGPYTIRAYDIGAISADTGYFGTLEWRHDLGSFASGQWQATAFVDSARVKINRYRWTTGENNATLSGAGIGLNWNGPNLWTANATLASRIGATPSLLNNPASVRAWVTVNKAF